MRGKEGVNCENSTGICPPPRVKRTAGGELLPAQELSAGPWDGLEGWDGA